MMKNFLCIHGHFYQPPRENPWIDSIEYQVTAKPFHDWNERICRECYGPNTRARILNRTGSIQKIINNYEYISFNFGPTLLSWMARAEPWIYAQLLAADRNSVARNDGHGNAMAQVYNHIIMPLANRRDKMTEIRWGLQDFKHRFGRPAEGMWLAETAVDTETLALLAQEGVKFTILNPHQAHLVRNLGDRNTDLNLDKAWKDVSGGVIDSTRPYRVFFDPEGRRYIDVFFYDQLLSRAVAFEGLLRSGKSFLDRILERFTSEAENPRLVNLATDGESYGHHYQFGEMALSWLIENLERSDLIKLTNFGCFLQKFPPAHEVRIFENSSWSCAHGVERWKADCGCKVGSKPGWNQAWRKPLRDGLNWLGDELAGIFEEQLGSLFLDPWAARDDYISLLLNPTAAAQEAFLARHSSRPLGEADRRKVFQLLDSQRMSLFMSTSCGWFFDDISGIEPTQNLKYAARAMDLISPWLHKDLEQRLLEFLEVARSNDPAYESGAKIYRTEVLPSRIGPDKAVANRGLQAIVRPASSFQYLDFEHVQPVDEFRILGENYDIALTKWHISEYGAEKVWNKVSLAYRYLERMDFTCLVSDISRDFDLKLFKEKLPLSSPEEIAAEFKRRLPDYRIFTLHDAILDTRFYALTGQAAELSEAIQDALAPHYNYYLQLKKVFTDSGMPLPGLLVDVSCLLTDYELSASMDKVLRGEKVDWTLVEHRLKQNGNDLPERNKPDLTRKAEVILETQMRRLAEAYDPELAAGIVQFFNLLEAQALTPNTWMCQNMFHEIYHNRDYMSRLEPGMPAILGELGKRLNFAGEETQNA